MKTYLVNFLCYLGLAPEIWLMEARKSQAQNNPHVRIGLVLNMLFAAAVVLFIAGQAAGYFMKVNSLNRQQALAADDMWDFISVAPLLLWGILFLMALLSYFVHLRPVGSLLTRPFRSTFFTRFALGWGFTSQVLFLLLVGVYFRATYLVRSHAETPSVYMLYENVLIEGGKIYRIPGQIFVLGFYPVAELSAARWGDTSIAVEPITRAGLEKAIKNGRMVVLATHGGYMHGSVSMEPGPYDDIYPEDVAWMGGAGHNLQFVYFSACNAGEREADWREALAPAEIVTFDRISWIPEHVFWLVFQAPGVVLGLR